MQLPSRNLSPACGRAAKAPGNWGLYCIWGLEIWGIFCYITHMGTYLAIQNRVEGRVIDLPSFVSSEVPTLINSAIRHLQNAHNFKVMEALLERTTTADSSSLGSVPSNFKEFRGRPYYLTEAGDTEFMEIAASRQAVQGAVNTLDIGSPYFILEAEPTTELNARALEVYPIPDGNSDQSDGEYRVKMPYWKYLADLSADGDTNWFTQNAEEYIVDKATALGFGLDWDYQSEAVWTQKSENWKKDVIKADKLARLGGVDTLVPHWRGARSPLIRA